MESISDIVRYTLVGLFALFAVIRLVAPAVLRRIYSHAEYSETSIRVIAIPFALSSAFLLIPHTHIWGIALAAVTLFLSIVAMLHRQRYGFAALGIVVMTALPIAVMAAPLA